MRTREASYLMLAGVTAAAVAAFAFLAIRAPEWQLLNHSLHTALEGGGALSALVTAWLLYERRRGTYGGRLFGLSLGFFSMGLLDLLHAVPVPGEGFVLLHSAASVVGASCFAMIWLSSFDSSEDAAWKSRAPWIVGALCAVFWVWSLAPREVLPVMVEEGGFSPSAVALNFLAGALFVAGAARLLVDFHRLRDARVFVLGCIAALFGIASLMWPFSALWGSTWWFWHVLRFLAYMLALWFAIREDHRALAAAP